MKIQQINDLTTTDSVGVQMATDLQHAYDFFNVELFSGKLPPCSVNLKCTQATYGHFVSNALVNHDGGRFAHEIRLNPSYFLVRTLKDTLSTLVHQMAHMWVAETTGKTNKRQLAYHGRKWGKLMKKVGLHPSATGKEFLADGVTRPKEIGDKMSQYIVADGPFDRAAERFLQGKRFYLHWLDRYPATVPEGMEIPSQDHLTTSDGEVVERPLGASPKERFWRISTEGLPHQIPEERHRLAAKEAEWLVEGRAAPTRSKYECRGCHTLIWGKAGLDLQCTPCNRPFEASLHNRAYGAVSANAEGSMRMPSLQVRRWLSSCGETPTRGTNSRRGLPKAAGWET